MNQLKQIFGVSANISNRVPLKVSSIARSAGTNGRDSKRSRDILVATSDSENSSELKLSGRSYAKLIADYGKEIEARNAATRLNGDARNIETKGGFFSKTPFERLTQVSSLVKIKSGRTNRGSGLSTKSSARLPVNPSKTKDGSTKFESSLDDALNQVIERAEWLDNMTKIHNSKRATRTSSSPYDSGEGKIMAHPLVQRIAKSSSTGNADSNELINMHNRQISSVKNIPDIPRSDTKNIAVTVKPLKKSDKDKNDLSMVNGEDNNAMLVTLTEESKSSSTSKSSPLHHIDLRINGKPATGVKTVASRVEKLDVVSSAEKIEIRIPVISDATARDKLQTSNSTISVYITSQEKTASVSHKIIAKMTHSGDSGSAGSRTDSSHPSTFLISKVQNVGKSSERLKVVPWWTTVESFRRSEIVSEAIPSERATIAKNPGMKISGVGVKNARRNQEVNLAEVEEIAVGDAEMRVKPVVTKLSSPRHRSTSRRKGTSAISKILENELLKKSEQQQQEEQKRLHRVPIGKSRSDVTPQAKPDTKVKSTASNEPKKETPSVAIGSSMTGKSTQAGTPTSDKFRKKMPSTLGSTVAASGGESKSEFKSSKREDTSTNNNLSSANDFKGRIHAKPISVIGKGNTDVHGRTTRTGQVPRDLGSSKVGSKVGTKPLQEVSSESETNEAPRLPRTYGKIKLLPSTQSLAKPVNNPKNGRCASIKPNGSTTNTGEKLSNAKNPMVTIKPIEKKKDGTLIDYGVTVTTRKKLERKLSGSRSANAFQRKKTTKQEQPVVIATIKEVIPKRNRDARGRAINRNLENSTIKKNDPEKNRRRMSETRDHCRAVQKKWNKIPTKGTPNEPNESRTPGTPLNTKKRNSKASTESQVVESVTPDKKLLYSVWLRRFKERTGQDPDPTKDPTSRDS